MIFTDFMVITAILGKIFGKELDSTKTGQDQRTLISSFLYVLTIIAKTEF